MNLPIHVTRGSMRILKTGPFDSFSTSSRGRSASALATIERNLSMRKTCPSMPTRLWPKKTGPALVALISSAMSRSSGESTASAATATTTSSARFSANRHATERSASIASGGSETGSTGKVPAGTTTGAASSWHTA